MPVPLTDARRYADAAIARAKEMLVALAEELINVWVAGASRVSAGGPEVLPCY